MSGRKEKKVHGGKDLLKSQVQVQNERVNEQEKTQVVIVKMVKMKMNYHV